RQLHGKFLCAGRRGDGDRGFLEGLKLKLLRGRDGRYSQSNRQQEQKAAQHRHDPQRKNNSATNAYHGPAIKTASPVKAKNPGIRTPRASATDLTTRFGALPI